MSQSFPTGTRVMLHSLHSAKDLNGVRGEVFGFDVGQERCKVKLDVVTMDEYAAKAVSNGAATKLVKPSNLILEPFAQDFNVLPSATNDQLNQLFHQISTYIDSEKGKLQIENMMEEKTTGMRQAPLGSNIWLYVEKKDTPTAAIDAVLSAILKEKIEGEVFFKTPQEMRHALVSYIKERTTIKGEPLLEYDNFTLVVSYSVGSEAVHSGLPKDYVEMGLCLTDQKPAIMVYKSDLSSESPEDAIKQMFPGLSDTMLEHFTNDAEISDLIKNHGHIAGKHTLLNPGATLKKGEISIVKGGRLYAEPANDYPSDGARIMLVGSATKKVFYARSQEM